MKRFLLKVWAFCSLRNFIKFFLWAVTLLILLHVEEDWRGARAWAATKAKWEGRGETFDPAKFIPPRVPDAENLAALPLFKLSIDPGDKSQLVPMEIKKAIHDDLVYKDKDTIALSYKWDTDKPPDFEKFQQTIFFSYAVLFGHPPGTNDPLDQLETIYPFIHELNAASATRPDFRLAEDYTTLPPQRRTFQLLVNQLSLAKRLSWHALLALHEKKVEVALVDIQTLAKMTNGISTEPSLVSGLVTVGICSINLRVICHGLSIHAWSDVQLAKIQTTLAQYDVLTNFQHVMRGECACYSLPMLEIIKQRPRSGFFRHLEHSNDSFADSDVLDSFFWSDGWIDQSMSNVANDLLSAASVVDVKAHRVYVEKLDKPARFDSDWRNYLPWNLLSSLATGPIQNAGVRFSFAQSQIDEARIACALERYRLAHGVYPDPLDALVPASIDAVPCDPINGESYHYRIRPDGTFLLYSVGWNQKDDGGVAVLTLEQRADDYDSPLKQGDWVWPTPKITPSK